MSRAPRIAHRGRPAGFTLLEILVVVAIIGILVTFATLSIGNRALDDRMDVEATRLEQILRLASEEAEIKNVELGFYFTASGYGFYAVGKDGKWAPYTESGPLRLRQLPAPFFLELRTEGRFVPPGAEPSGDQQVKIQPQVFLLSSGEATAASFDLKAPNYRPYYHIELDALSKLTRERRETQP